MPGGSRSTPPYLIRVLNATHPMRLTWGRASCLIEDALAVPPGGHRRRASGNLTGRRASDVQQRRACTTTTTTTATARGTSRTGRRAGAPAGHTADRLGR